MRNFTEYNGLQLHVGKYKQSKLGMHMKEDGSPNYVIGEKYSKARTMEDEGERCY